MTMGFGYKRGGSGDSGSGGAGPAPEAGDAGEVAYASNPGGLTLSYTPRLTINTAGFIEVSILANSRPLQGLNSNNITVHNLIGVDASNRVAINNFAPTDPITAIWSGNAGTVIAPAGSTRLAVTPGIVQIESGTVLFLRGTSVNIRALSNAGNSLQIGSNSSSEISGINMLCANGGTINIGSNSGGTATTVQLASGPTVRIASNGTGVGFFGAAPVAQPNITGSRGGNAALASLLTALANLGLITDSTTA